MEASGEIQTSGIVTLGGGRDYFLNAYINVVTLRKLGCKLPILWCHLGTEMTPAMLERAQAIEGVTLLNLAPDSGSDRNEQAKGGWQAKVKAILAAPFEEILFLDADCFAWRDPAYLFHHYFFQTHDCVFWPDPFHWNADQQQYLKDKYELPELPAQQIESGQMMFRKSRCVDALEETLKLNERSDETYQDVYGDKDTFMFGALRAGVRVGIAPFGYDELTKGMLQKDFDGEPLFSHLAHGKFRDHGRLFIQESDWPQLPLAKEIYTDLKTNKVI